MVRLLVLTCHLNINLQLDPLNALQVSVIWLRKKRLKIRIGEGEYVESL